MIKQISNYIREKPYLVQAAKDGFWEKAFKMNLADSDFKKERLLVYLEKEPFKSLDIELFFKNDDEVYILGLSFNNDLLVHSTLDFLTSVIHHGKRIH